MVGPVRRHFESEGFRVYANPDGSDYFDLIVRRGAEIGMLELKRAEGRRVFEQAVRRRFWGNWVGVAVGSRTSAQRLAVRRSGRLTSCVGIWWVHNAGVETIRPPSPFPPPAEPREERTRLVAWLDLIDRGEVPVGTVLEGLGRAIRGLGHGRAYREWTLEELGGHAGRRRQG